MVGGFKTKSSLATWKLEVVSAPLLTEVSSQEPDT
jgi:hypothetical protein